MKTTLLTLLALVELGQLASGGIGLSGFKGTFTTDSLYHGKTGRGNPLAVASGVDPGQAKPKTHPNASRGHRPPLQRVSSTSNFNTKQKQAIN